MNLDDQKYNRFSLVREMMETPKVIADFPIKEMNKYLSAMKQERFLLTGEGSSRIFPAMKIIYDSLRNGWPGVMFTEGAAQSQDYALRDTLVFVASNSGRTKEAVRLIEDVKKRQGSAIFAIVGHDNTPIQEQSDIHYLLRCGAEKAVAATKSVVEQALFYDILFRMKYNAPLPDLEKLAELFESVLTAELPMDLTDLMKNASTIYWAGLSNGVAEELTLKTNEIIRKPADFLAGTYAVHGIEEVMAEDQLVILLDLFEEEEKYEQVLAKGVGMSVIAVADLETRFRTVTVPEFGEFTPYLQMAAGWSLLVETGIALGIDLDKPVRARKIGYEV